VCGPQPLTLTLTDSLVGTTVLTYSAASGTWNGSMTYNYPGVQTCAPVANLVLSYSFNPGNPLGFSGLTMTWNAVSQTIICPTNANTGFTSSDNNCSFGATGYSEVCTPSYKVTGPHANLTIFNATSLVTITP
jgi:hypothetical protein